MPDTNPFGLLVQTGQRGPVAGGSPRGNAPGAWTWATLRGFAFDCANRMRNAVFR